MMNILIIKIGAIGDVAMATTMLPVIQKLYPNATVTWVVGKQAAPILRALENAPVIFEVDDQVILRGRFLARCKELLRVAAYLRFRRYSLILVPYLSKKYLMLCLAARGPKRAFWQKRAAIPGRYRGVNYIRLLSGADGCSENAPFNAVCGDCIDTPLFPQLKCEQPTGDNIPEILLVPGGAKNILADSGVRRWPLEHYVVLTEMLLAKGYRVGIIGGQTDAWVRDAFLGLNVTDYIGKLALGELLGLLGRTRLLITHDTGPMHMMGLVGGKIVALFGPTLPEEFSPLRNTIALTAPGFFPCRPCYDGKNFAEGCTIPVCMESIRPQVVFDAAQGLLATHQSVS